MLALFPAAARKELKVKGSLLIAAGEGSLLRILDRPSDFALLKTNYSTYMLCNEVLSDLSTTLFKHDTQGLFTENFPVNHKFCTKYEVSY